jgi:hypothetical protein
MFRADERMAQTSCFDLSAAHEDCEEIVGGSLRL